MQLLFLSDLIKGAGIDPKKVKLIRHALSDKGFYDCYNAGMLKEYTAQQKDNFSNGYDYWMVFISDNGTNCRLECCYKVGDSVKDTETTVPKGFTHPEWYKGKNSIFELEEVDLFADYEKRLVIDWGKATRSWAQKGTTEKPIIAIQANQRKEFSGYENVILTYDDLKEIVDDSITYENWHTALSSVYAIYLIVDTVSGKQYVGSAYGKGGLLGRWSIYVATKHGNNKKMKDIICNYPDRYKNFQFSILQILPKTITDNEVFHTESLWKSKLLSKEPFGMNEN